MHCIRFTTIPLLNHSGFEPRNIVTCAVSGHRHRSFCQYTALTPQVQYNYYYNYEQL